ncbi:MAG: hypothetical protein IPK83_18880 [Planctomycetes bacterium]|nr:hypothetical protein [Planctomycetota bacterium]
MNGLAARVGFAGAFIVALMAGPVVKRLAIRFDFFDRPDGGLKPHDRPIPYLGGLAIYMGWLAAIATATWASASNSDAQLPASPMSRPLLWIALGGTVMMLTGLIDDRRHVPPMLRLAIQAAVSGILILGIGAKSGLHCW